MKARWVNKIKLEADGSRRYKSRLVGKGFQDANDYERGKVYAPVARMSDMRFIFIIAQKFNLKINQFDIRTAFLNSFLQKRVFMEVPEGLMERLGEQNSFKQKKVCELKRSLYGLKVSPKRWYLRFTEVMKNMMFETYPFQSTLFVWRERERFAILLLYVDDILLTSNCEMKMNEIKTRLMKEFEVTDLGEPKKFLGIEILRREDGTTLLHQRKFIETVLKRFKMSDAKMKQNITPMRSNDLASKIQLKAKNEYSNLKEILYRQAIGLSLIHISEPTRPY